MAITSVQFAGFVLAAAAVYRLLDGRARLAWLLLVSLGFYATWDWRFGIFLLALTFVNFWLGKRLGQKASPAWMWAGIGLNVAALLAFKYPGFYLDALSDLLSGAAVGALALIIPIGLSFYLVQVISYFVDVSLKRIPPEEDWLLFVLYLFYFPKLVSGPIERARTFIPKLVNPAPVDAEALKRNFSLVMVGLVRKLVVADSLVALIPDGAFTTPLAFAGQHLFVWLLAYAFALYNDFAGYTSIVRGVSGLFGIELSSNFMRPYFSSDFTDFWKRWHISLSEWLRDYIFFPTMRRLMRTYRDRQHIFNLVAPPMATMLVSGLWHGVSWQMVLWGGLHGIYQVIERVINLRRTPPPPDQQPRWRKAAAVILVFMLTVLAWLPFRMNVPTAWEYLQGIFTPAQWASPALRQAASDLLRGRGFWSWPEYGLPDPRVFLVIVPSLWLDWRQEKQEELFFRNWSLWGQAALLAAAILLLLLVSGADAQVPFVYQGF